MDDKIRSFVYYAEETAGGELLSSLIGALSHDFTPDQASSIVTAIMLCTVCGDAIKEYWNTNRDNIVSTIEQMKTEGDI